MSVGKKSYFFFIAGLFLPPPLLNCTAFKKKTFFAASLTDQHSVDKARFLFILRARKKLRNSVSVGILSGTRKRCCRTLSRSTRSCCRWGRFSSSHFILLTDVLAVQGSVGEWGYKMFESHYIVLKNIANFITPSRIFFFLQFNAIYTDYV